MGRDYKSQSVTVSTLARMFVANNGDLVERMGQEFSGLLGSPRRMCEAASEQKRAAA